MYAGVDPGAGKGRGTNKFRSMPLKGEATLIS